MKLLRKKHTFSIFAAIALTTLMLTPIISTQLSFAQIGIPSPTKSAGYISVAPTLIGVGQTATVNLWIFPLPENYLHEPLYSGYTGITVTFVKPDGTKDIFMPVDGTGHFVPGETESLGTLFFYYKPDMAGNWSVTMSMPEQNITDTTGTVIYQACTSKPAYFTVQTDPVFAGLLNGYPYLPLPNPNVFWNYPINSNNRDWNKISGDWLQPWYSAFTAFFGTTYNLWQPYGPGPDTPHIVWSEQLNPGGLVGGDYGSYSYGPLLGADVGAVIMEGKVFANMPNSQQFKCVDLATGEVLYTAPGIITCGIHLPGNAHFQSINDPSVILGSSYGNTPIAYLFGTSGTTWNYYDPLTGAKVRSLSDGDVHGVGFFYGSRLVDGTNFAYGTTVDGQLFAWDLSKVVNNNWTTGITWKSPLPESITKDSLSRYANPFLFAISSDVSTLVLRTINQFWGFSADDGTLLWNLNVTYPVIANEVFSLWGVDDFIVFNPVDTTWHCYSMHTGSLLWTSPSFADSTWATTWSIYDDWTNDYENLYLQFPDGTMTALSLETGQELWRSEPMLSTEYTTNVVPYSSGMLMMGGNIYGYAGYAQGYQINPIPRFAMMVCVNASTGEIVWTLNGGIRPVAASSGYVIGLSAYDQKLYCIGKGPTKTTVMASPKISAKESSVLIEGSVIDMSTATQEPTSQVLFPNGVSAVADDDMSEWMDYLHMQNATLLNNPPTPKGVTARLAAVGPNGNVIDIGTVTSDSGGMFKKTWTPPSEGEYTVYATFDGSDSYWGSHAETGLSVTAAPTQSGSVGQQTVPDYTMTIIGGVIAVIIAVALVGVILYRKK